MLWKASHLHIWKKLQKIEMIILGIGIMIEEMEKKENTKKNMQKAFGIESSECKIFPYDLLYFGPLILRYDVQSTEGGWGRHSRTHSQIPRVYEHLTRRRVYRGNGMW